MNGQFASAAGKVLTATLVGVALSTVAAAQEPRIGASALQQIDALMQEKASRTPSQRKISSDLLFEARRQRGEAIVQGLSSVRSSVRSDRAGRVLVDIKAEVTDGLLRRLEGLGGRVVSDHAGYGAIRANVPLLQLEALAQSPQVRFIRTASLPIASKVNTSEGDVTHMADLARTDLGVDGTGVKVCVLSDSVDSLAEVQASGDLPPTIDILPGQDGVALGAAEGVPETIGEGTATLEIIHDLAPGAALGFATGWLDQASFAQNISDLRTSGCDVLIDNVIHATEPVFQDGIIAQAIDNVVADGAVYFSAAQNFGNLSDGTSSVWEGDYFATAVPVESLSSEYETAHDFGGGTALNTITTDTPFGFTLQWSDPQGGSTNDYDLFLISANGNSVILASTAFQTSGSPGNPFEFIDSRNLDHTGMHLLIVRMAGAAGRYLHLNALGGQLAIATAGQTWGHSSARSAVSVAAVDWFQGSGTPTPFTGAESVETYSSDGPRRVFYEADGTPITPGDVSATGGELRQKPNLAAADNVSTATPGFEAFFGTSASAAHAAAIAGLMLSKKPALSTADLRDILAQTALDIEAPGVDRDSGAGIVDAAAALGALKGAVATDFNADALSDILWRNSSTGNTVIYQMDGFTKSAAGSIGAPSTAWVIKDAGDFDNDLRADILWRRNVTGEVVIWMMDGFTLLSSRSIGTTTSGAWDVAGLGDFDGDRNLDILWRNGSSGETAIWQMDGFVLLLGKNIGTIPLVWKIAGVADFNNDGVSDILWRNSDTGSTVVWQMNALAMADSITIGAPPPAWKIVGMADFGGGGQDDILWRNSNTNQVVIWQMNGYTLEASSAIGTVDSDWLIVRLGDYNGGGEADILWRRRSDGDTVIWQMSDFRMEAAQSIGTVTGGWEVQ